MFSAAIDVRAAGNSFRIAQLAFAGDPWFAFRFCLDLLLDLHRHTGDLHPLKQRKQHVVNALDPRLTAQLSVQPENASCLRFIQTKLQLIHRFCVPW